MEMFQNQDTELSKVKSQVDMALSDAEKYRLLYDDEKSKNLRNETLIKELKAEKASLFKDIKSKVDSLPSEYHLLLIHLLLSYGV